MPQQIARSRLLILVLGALLIPTLFAGADDGDNDAARKAILGRVARLEAANDTASLLEAFRLLGALDERDRRGAIARRLVREHGAGLATDDAADVALYLLGVEPGERAWLKLALAPDLAQMRAATAPSLADAQHRLAADDPIGAYQRLLLLLKLPPHAARACDILRSAARDRWAAGVLDAANAEWRHGDAVAAINRVAAFRRATGALAAGSALHLLDLALRTTLDLPTTDRDDAPDYLLAGFTLLGTNAGGHREYQRPRDGAVMIELPDADAKLGADAKTTRVTGGLIDRTSVTNAMFARYLNAKPGAGRDDSIREHAFGLRRDDSGMWYAAGNADAPVVGVTLVGAQEYALWAGVILPPGELREYAARGTDGRVYPWGAAVPTTGDALAVCELNSIGRPMPVGSMPGGASPCGALDMAGNVWEWCSDRYGDDDGRFVVRGGSCRSGVDDLRTFHQEGEPADASYGNLGFRCAYRWQAGHMVPPAMPGSDVAPRPAPPVFQPLPLEQLPAFEPLPAALQKLLEPVADAPAHDTTGVPMQVWRRKTDGAHVVRVPAGRMPVGDATGYGRDNERPLRWLWLPEFFIDDCEISNAQFATFLNASAPTGDERIAWIGLRDPRSQLGFDGTRYAPLPGCENLPVVLVSHAGACAYSLWAWGRDPRDAMIDCCLPTAAQWERAAAFDPLHGCKREFPWGDSPPRELLPDGGESRARAHQVNAGRRIGEAEPTAWQELPLAPVRGENDDDAFAAGRTPAGLWHMAGNVREWLVTPIGEHPCPDELLPTQPDFTAATWLRLPASAFGGDLSVAYREVRGGSWHSGHASELRVTCRDLSRADQMHDDVGFRCAMPSGLGPALDPGLQSASMAGPETAAAGEEFVPARLRDIGDKAKGSAGEFAIYRRPRDSADMILIPAGTAKMGGGASRDANPVHDVTLGAFLIDRAEVSAAAFVMFLNAVKSRTVPDGWPDAGEVMILNEAIVGDGNFMMRADPLQLQGPITGVTWYGAQAYARWVGAVLPTEAQWERAARGTGDGPYPWGSAAPTDGVHAIFARNRPAIALGQVNDAARAAGESPYGVRDMAGNVWEWCADCYDPLVYADASRSGRDPLIGWPPGLRVNRGGGFRSPADALAVWTRAADPPGVSYDCLGFRCALPATLVPELASDDESRESEPR